MFLDLFDTGGVHESGCEIRVFERVIVSANIINPVILVSIWTMKIVSAKKGQQIN